MARAGKWTQIWVEGYTLSTRLNDVVPPHNSYTEIESSGYLQDHNYTLGQGEAVATLNGYFDSSASTHAALNAISSGVAKKVVSVAYGNNAAPVIGDISSSMVATQSAYTSAPVKDALIGVTANFKAVEEGVNFPDITDWGIVLANLTGITADNTTASVDNGASSSNGGVGYLHITGISAGDTVVVLIEDSTDDAIWDTLITFTLDGSALDAERIEVTGTVNRYVRVNYNVTGTDVDIDLAVFFSRK